MSKKQPIFFAYRYIQLNVICTIFIANAALQPWLNLLGHITRKVLMNTTKANKKPPANECERLLIGFLCIKKGVKMRKLIFNKFAPVFASIKKC